MAVTDAQFAALVARVKALEDYHAPNKVKAVQTDLDNAHAAFLALRDQHDALDADTHRRFVPRAAPLGG